MPRGKRSPDQTQVTFTLSKDLLAQIDGLATEDDRTRSNWIVHVLRQFVAQRAEKKKGGPHLHVIAAETDSIDSTLSARVAEEPPTQRKRK